MGAEHDVVRVPLGALGRLIESALITAGFNRDNAQVVGATMLAAERDGVRSHGLLRLKGFMHSVRIGWADGRATPEIASQQSGLFAVDARNGFAQAALALVREQLVERARSNGTVVLATRNSHHFAALWPDVEPFAEAGFVALSCVTSKARMAVWGGGRPVTGTNAMAFACPRAGHPPLVFDQSSSVMSQGDVLLAAAEKREVPAGVGVDTKGHPTRDPSAILNGGALLPFGGHKGASIAVMVEILAAALSGAPFGFEDTSPGQTATTSLGGQCLLLIDPSRANPDFGMRIETLIGAIRASGATRLPGERRHHVRNQSIADGVAIPRREIAALEEMA